MNTVDNLVLKIVNYLTPTIEECISSRDAKVLRSMATSIASQYFITENQSKLIIKILKENSKKMPEFSEEIDQAIVEVIWSRPFRQIPEIKKLYISKNNDGDSVLCLESSFLPTIRHKISQISFPSHFNRKDPSARFSTIGSKCFFQVTSSSSSFFEVCRL